MTQAPLHLRLDEAEFRDLVAGRVVKLQTVEGTEIEIILADIGWTRITLALHDAIYGSAIGGVG